MHVVLVEPEIPQNTGNVARTCVLTDSTLHLVEPLGFSISDRQVRRAGLDYWPYLKLQRHPDFLSMRRAYPEGRFLFYSTRGTSLYTAVSYSPGDFLVFGSETKGLPPELIKREPYLLRIPMVEQISRSLNLGNSVALVLYEALRQQGFPNLK